MKKSIYLLSLLLILSLLFSACLPELPEDSGSNVQEEEIIPDSGKASYSILFSGEISLLNKVPSITSEAGKTVNFSVTAPESGYPVVKLDGETLQGSLVFGNYRYSFVMPEHDVSLHIAVGTRQEQSLASDEVGITFVSLNDVHGSIEQNEYGKEGLSNTKVAIDRLSAFYEDNDESTTERDDIVLFANGDMFQGSAISNMSRGRSVLEAMNAMGFDAMGLGNHEFDWGLETVLAYFDGDESNGEADFPLTSCNISTKADDVSIADASENDNIVTSVIVEKMGIKIGLIGAIGPVENSIIRSAVEPYTLEDVTSSVKTAATALKKEGAQMIAVSIHYGTSSGDVTDYDANVEIAKLKDESGDYLVDLIFNGHTHYCQKGEIARSGGISVPVIQAGANNECIGVISVVCQADTGEIKSFQYDYDDIADVGTAFDSDVEEIITNYNKELIESLPVLATSGVTVGSKYELAPYVADIMVKAFDADFSCSNYGGLRSTGDIVQGESITENNLYEIIPFDNTVYLVTLPGSVIYYILKENGSSWFFGYGSGAPDLGTLQRDTSLYTLAVIDYVYTNTYFNSYRAAVTEEYNTQYVLRDLLVEDVSLFGDAGEPWSFKKSAKIENKLH